MAIGFYGWQGNRTSEVTHPEGVQLRVVAGRPYARGIVRLPQCGCDSVAYPMPHTLILLRFQYYDSRGDLVDSHQVPLNIAWLLSVAHYIDSRFGLQLSRKLIRRRGDILQSLPYAWGRSGRVI